MRSAGGVRMSAARREFCEQFFAELERQDIAYAILDRYRELPRPDGSDIDYAVADSDLRKIGPLLSRFARRRGWIVAQSVQHEIFSFYTVVVDPGDPDNSLALDVRSHLTSGHRMLVRDSALLEGRWRNQFGYFIASPASEFIYVLAKAVGKETRIAKRLPRLRALAALDPEGARARFEEAFGETGQSLEDWLDEPRPTWEPLRRLLRARHRYRVELVFREGQRIARRLIRPPGLHIAVLGPDGAGKSTLIENIRGIVGPCFGDWKVIKFRPDVLGRIEPGMEPDPHGREPRSRVISWVKVVYYFGDTWLGWFLVVLPGLARNNCVTFDRDFEDLLVDERRYLVRGSATLARILRACLPRAEATFILEADPQVIHARKPELSVPELEAQRGAYRRLAASGRRYHLVSAEQPPNAVANEVSGEILAILNGRHTSSDPAKRGVDVVASLAALVLLSPLLAAVAVLVRLKLGSPVLFRQERPGLAGRPFTLYKFRTMKNTTYSNGRRRPDVERQTVFGTWLRGTSLDELPELVNVLKGEMSVVGPRPLLLEYLPRYTSEQMRRHDVRPGITGWAQINGRNTASWREKFEFDVWYVDNRSMLLDLKIIAVTIWKVLRREGITPQGGGTVERFFGTEGLEESPKS
jgi:lipopolysaccharide/colanic/teichoic acid biosynthesis glycosyltransferase